MSKVIRLNDRMISNDDLRIVNHINRNKSECAAPHGRLFELLGIENGHRMVREIACNTVVVGGAITALENLTGATANWRPKTINEVHGISAQSTNPPILSLFGIGVGGSNLNFGSVIEPDIKQIDLKNPIPIRCAPSLTDEDAAKYFMKIASGTNYNWYLKEFASAPVIKTCWKNSVDTEEDGTEITSDIYESSETTGIESFTEITINLNVYDGREYFEVTSQTGTARYNEIGFYTGAKNAANTEYANVRLYSTVTFNNYDLSVRTKRTLIYRIYSLI